jgi:hypothetical protein
MALVAARNASTYNSGREWRLDAQQDKVNQNFSHARFPGKLAEDYNLHWGPVFATSM